MGGQGRYLLASLLLASDAIAANDEICPSDGCAIEEGDGPSLLQVNRLARTGGDQFPFGQPWWIPQRKPSNFNARIFKPVHETLASQNIGLGLSVSGGGNRAFTYAMGVFRALHQLDLVSDIEFISSVSGGSWFASLYVYAEGSTEELLGAPTTPSQLTMAALDASPSKFGQRVVAATTEKLYQVLTYATFTHTLTQAWQNFVGDVYLKPFGLDGAGYLAQDKAHVAQIKKDNPSLKNAYFTLPRTDRPKLAMQCILFAPVGYNISWHNVMQLEVSPQFTGVTTNKKVSYAPLSRSSPGYYPTTNLTRIVGGGFVETFAFGGKAPTKEVMAGQVPASSGPFTLKDAVGAGSMSPGGQLAQAEIGLMANPRVNYWPVPSKEFPTQEKETQYEIGDGGSIENSGILPLLSRGAKKVFFIDNSYSGLNMSYPWEEACAEGSTMDFDPVVGGVVGELTALYGYGDPPVSNIPAGFFWEHNQVFEQSGVRGPCCQIWKAVSAGEPAVVQWSDHVLPNEWHSVTGGYTVDIMMVSLQKYEKFEDQLPRDTQVALAKGVDGPFARFPIYNTQWQNSGEIVSYTNAQVNLLAAQGEQTILSTKDKVAKFLSR